MNNRDAYMAGPAAGAEVRKNGEVWTLIVVRELSHPPEKVWKALTDPASLREWAPFDADRDLDTVGPVQLKTVGAPASQASESQVTRAEAPHLLEYSWGHMDLRWQLEPLGIGTRLTLWHNIGGDFIAMGAAGWHICLDVFDGFLAGDPIGRIVGGDAMKFGWPRLNGEYSTLFGVEPQKVKT
jgi:uncharacterized protein YndB with AHSA1/START domain